MDHKDKKVILLLELLHKLDKAYKPRVLLIGVDFVLYRDKSNFVLERFLPSQLTKNLELDRGEVLDIFSKIEVLVNALVVQAVVKDAPDEQNYLYEILDNIDLFSKIKLLKNWGVINNKTETKLILLKQVRNAFAHSWGIHNVKYGTGYLSDKAIFEKFVMDIGEAWQALADKYSVDLDALINKYRGILGQNGS